MKKVIFIAVLLSMLVSRSFAQYYSTPGKTIPGVDGSVIYDTINVSGLSPSTIDGTWGLDSVTLNISYDYDANLVISLISPDGTVVHLADKDGYSADFTNATFSMDVTNFVKDSHSPFTGNQQPEGWLGMVNNGSSGNGHWVLRILNQPGGGLDSGILINWGVHFSHTPAPPKFFDSSTLPIVVINTNDTIIDIIATPVQGKMGIIDNGTHMNHTTDPFNNYNGHVSLHSHGSSTLSFPTLSFSLTTEAVSGADTDAALIGMPADHSWVLYAPWDDKTFMRNIITYRLSNDMGEYAPRTRPCQLILNGDYRGVYVMIEKISHGSNRVNVHKMTTADTTGTALTGGYIIETDRGTPGPGGWASSFSTCDSGGDNPEYLYVYPKSTDIEPPQDHYIVNYVDSFESKMKYHNLYDTVNGYRQYIDIPSFIDQQLLQELGRNVDAYRASTYFHKDRGGKLKGGPIWDFNEAYGNVNYDTAWDYNEWQWNEPCPYPGYNPFWWKKLTTDTTYFNDMRCRYSNLRLTTFDTSHIMGLIDSLAGVFTIPAVQHYKRWPVLGVYLWPEYYYGSTYNDDVTFMKTWIRHRIHFMDSVLFNPSCIDTATTPPSLGVVGTNPENKITIYPNPTDNDVYITASLPVNRITIVNMLGQQVYETTVRDTRYDISLRQYHLSSGIYTISVYSDKGMITRRKIVLTE